MPRFPQWPLVLRLYRAATLLVILLLVHQQAHWFAAQRGPGISLRQARKLFPSANRVQLRDPGRGLHIVTDARGDTVGALLTTSPFTDQILGYSGPNDLLIALDARGAIVGLELLWSGDTLEHVEKVRRDRSFLSSFVGWNPGAAALPSIDAVSGATLTSLAIAEAIQQRLAGAAPSLRFPDPVTLVEAQGLFTNASRVEAEGSRLRVLDEAGRLLGFAVRTSPQADNVSGYRGPSECLVALALDGRTILDLRIRRSYDTESYVDQVRGARTFLNLFRGRPIEELAAFEWPKAKIEGISGATQTARAVSEGIRLRAAAEIRSWSSKTRWRPKPRDWALAGVVVGALAMAFTSLRGYRPARITWQLLLVGYVGFVNHDLLSLALFGGWAANGFPFKAASGLVLLTLAALFVPWVTRRQLYCHHICPHGAAQQLLGYLRGVPFARLVRRYKSAEASVRTGARIASSQPSRFRLLASSRMLHVIEVIPVALLGFALIAVLMGWPINLASLEPFDAWTWGTAGTIVIGIALAGLVASIFVPQAYCRFGCPTGALLSFIRSSGSADRWGRRDSAALGFLAASVMAVVGVRAWPRSEPVVEPLKLTGKTMGTTWTVKIQDEVADPARIEKFIADEFELCESLTSHWRTNTDLSEFNRTATTNAMPVPWPVLTLSRQAAEISRATDGAYDITVGPLARLWGFGPGPARIAPPSDAAIAAALPAVGWQKLESLEGLLRKQHPALEVDLSSIAVGWAVDQVAQLIDRKGYTNYLVEAGGELRVRGRWTIAIEHPMRSCILTNESIGTSGSYRRTFESGGRRYSHLLDPRTGRPVEHRTVSVSVRHADCARADAWAAALNVLGIEDGLPLAERLGLAAQFVTEHDSGKLQVFSSKGWKAREALAVLESQKQR